MTMLVTGDIDVLEVYEGEIVATVNTRFELPSVARLRANVGHYKKAVKFSRVNVMTRDNFTCQYCGKRFAMKELNYDHVVPRHQGGLTEWTNIVTSCYPCNTRKDRRTPEQAGMRLLKKPKRPMTLPMTAPILAMRSIPKEWGPYVQAYAPLAQVGCVFAITLLQSSHQRDLLQHKQRQCRLH